jgi:glycosyltransferase involved in cell wall biosynthesis
MATERGEIEQTGAATVAVAVACYNQGHFLAQALASILAQSRPADEIILVDDGSTDDTAQVAARYPSVRYIRQRNGGLSAARNTALASTEAELILFLDADDCLAPEALASAVARLVADRRLAFVYGGYREVDVDLTTLSVHQARHSDNPFDDLLSLGNFIAMHGTVLYDAARLRESGGFDVTLDSCEDYDVFLRLARRHPVAAYDGVAADYRRHGQSLSRHSLRMVATSLRVLDRHVATPAQRALARRAKQVMLDFYLGPYRLEVSRSFGRGDLAALLRSLGHLLAAPRAWRPVARLAVPALVGRARRGVSRLIASPRRPPP